MQKSQSKFFRFSKGKRYYTANLHSWSTLEGFNYW